MEGKFDEELPAKGKEAFLRSFVRKILESQHPPKEVDNTFPFGSTVIKITEVDADCPTERDIPRIVWNAALVLCSYIHEVLPEGSLTGKRVVDLGAGTGILGILCATKGAHVTITEINSTECDNIRRNVGHNTAAIDAAGGSVKVDICDWTKCKYLTPRS